MQSHQIHPFGLYIHWPYCLSKCPYCDFFSRSSSPLDESVLLAGYKRDLADSAALPHTSDCMTSIYFGGGTPSLMSPDLMADLFTAIRQHFTVAPDAQITLEANPDAIDAAKMADFAALGVNRLSVGVQSLTPQGLRFLGRKHTVAKALQQLEQASRFFPFLNMDLIYARPDQTLKDWRLELKQALSLGLKHYSLYQLTIEPGTVFYKQAVQTPDDETARAFYELTDELTEAVGVPGYEVSNYAAAGAESRHNLIYWTGSDYIGIGPAAHGRIGLTATQNPANVAKWLASPMEKTTLTPAERFTERVLMGLRLRHHPFPVQGLNPAGVNRAVQNGWVTRTNDFITPTREGILMLNTLILTVLPD